MRRVILALVLIGFPGVAIASAFGPVSAAGPAVHVTKGKGTPHCTKGKKGKKGQKAQCPKPRKHPKATKHPKGKKKKATKHPATRTATPSPTPTSTATPTATLTPTATMTPTVTSTPSPWVATLSVQTGIPPGYRAGFFVCGLPAGVTATFDPNPAAAGGLSAQTTLSISVPYGTPPGPYDLAIHAYAEDLHGNPTNGAALQPPGAELTVAASGSASLAPLATAPAIGLQGCSQPPAGFAPAPTATPNPNDVQVVAWVSNAHPSAGQQETVYGSIQLNGQGVAAVPMTTHWYYPNNILTCGGVTGSTGIASCSLVEQQTIPDQTVVIQVTFTFDGRQYNTDAMFTS